MTKQRELILGIVRAAVDHLTAEQIYKEATQQMPGIALATVYNSLHYLCEQGLITRLSFLGQTDRYDKMFVPHDHMLCDRCGEIRDIELPCLPRILTEESGEAILSYDLTLHHICPKCRTAAANS